MNVWIDTAARRQRKICDLNVPSDIEEPGAGPGMITEGCALLARSVRYYGAQLARQMHVMVLSLKNILLGWKPVEILFDCGRDRVVFANCKEQTCSRI